MDEISLSLGIDACSIVNDVDGALVVGKVPPEFAFILVSAVWVLDQLRQ